MADLVDILEADHSDILAFVDITTIALRDNRINDVLFPGSIDDSIHSSAYMRWLMVLGFDEPGSRNLKAVHRLTGKVIGFARLALKRFRPDDSQQLAPKRPLKVPEDADEVFFRHYSGSLHESYLKYMAGTEYHWVWNSLYVLPAYQRKGIGTLLMVHAFVEKSIDLNDSPIWLMAQNKGYKLYERFGFEVVEDLDIDLSQYTAPFAGYGIHRTRCMVRPAQKR
ncbi:hypothetical protein MMC25_006653 [Agyrium rufum]|nr:hypothetical protein [Agyrium rufum]